MIEPLGNSPGYYSPIAFNERVTFWLQWAWSLPCAFVHVHMLHYLHIGSLINLNHYAIAHASMQQAHTHKAVTGCVEAKELLSCRRQSDYGVVVTNHTAECVHEALA